MAKAASTIPGAEAWSASGSGDRAEVGVMVVHGFTGNPVSTRPMGERLNEAGYTVEVPRLPGHGTDVRDLGTTRYRDWRAEVERLLDDLLARCEQVVMVGLSVGGTLTLDLAGARPEEVDAAVVINPVVLTPQDLIAKIAPVLQYLLPYLPRQAANLPVDDIAKPGADEHAYGWLSAKAAQSMIRELPRVRAQLVDLDQPLLVAYSPQDHTVPPANAKALFDLVASDDVTPLVLERSYHVATLDWDREILEEAVLAFVERVTGH